MFHLKFRVAAVMIDNIVANLLQQHFIVESQVLDPLRLTLQMVIGGIWRGDGAVAFVEELSSLMLPGTSRIAEDIKHVSEQIKAAQERMTLADEEVDRILRSRLTDEARFY